MSVAVTSCGLWLINNSPNALAQTPSAQVKTSKSVASASSTFDAGEEIVFNVAYSCASVLDPVCQNMVITDVIHPNLEFLGTTSLPDGATFNQAGGEVVINLGDIPAGDSRVFQLRARFPLGTLPGITATNQTIADADNANPVTSDIVDVVASSSFLMTANKSVITVPQTGVIGEGYQTTYQLNICNPNNGVGGVALLNPVLTDTLPAEVTPVLPLPYGGIYIPGSPPTSSNLALWQAGVGGFPTEIPVTEGCFTLEFPVEFNSATTGVVSGTVVNNVFTVSGNPADEPTDTVGLGPVGNNVTLRDPYYAASFEKTVASASNHPDDPGVEELPGGPVTYTLTLNNNGTLPISNTVVTDVLPTEIATVTTVGVVPITTGQTVTFSYELDNSGSWILGQTATETTVIDLSSLPGKVTALRWELGTMPFTITQWSVNVSGNISDTFISGSFDNCGGFTGFSQGSAQADGPDCATVEVIELRAIPRTDKQISNSNDVKPGSVVSYTLSVFNDSVAHNDVIAPITLADLLPQELDVVVLDGGSYRPATAADSWYQIVSQPGGTPAPTVAFTPTYGANNETLLRWQWPGPFQLAPGERIDLTFAVRVKHGTLPGPLDNRSIILWNPATLNPLYCIGNQIYTDTINIDEDGDSVENGCQSDNEPTNVAVYLAMESQKFVLGELDGGIWNKDGLTVPGGQVNYRMHITNLSNITTTNLVVYDIFPFVGDTGNIDTTPRGSDWRPNLQAPIAVPAGLPLSIQYSQSGNPCRPEILPSGPPGCTDDWSATPPADVTSVQAARFEFCDGGNCLELAPDDGSGNGGSLVLTWIMQAPNDAPNDPERAWNTFGFTAEGGGLNLLPAEPNRVGIRVTRSLTTASLGDYVWLDVYGTQNDGIQQPEESGINGVRVELRDENGDPYDFNNDGQPDYRITGNDADGNPGYYLFVGLDPALTYTVRFYPPVTYTLGPPLAVNYNLSISNTSSTTDGLDSDGITTGNVITYGNYVQTQPITFTPGITVDLTWDQGLWLPTDYGDAPNSYNTRATGSMTPANAARHVILPNIYMGNGVDDELDGTPDPTSFLDDAGDGNDDEDGVVFEYYRGPITQPTPIFIVGDTSDLTVTTVVTVPANYRGYLNAWIDFNRDGDFDDAGEQIATDQQAPVNGGIINVSVSVPATAITGTSYARFRFSTESGLGPSGGARDGEVEDYPLLILPGDYGDLPDGSVSGSPNPPNYPTTSSNDGARHAINPINNPTLGGSVDDELDGQPSRNATGDGADENGVVFTSDIVPGEIMTLTVTASVTDGLLNAWIDFNFDGDFDDLNERLATNQPIAAGATITITANVPLTATQALTAYSRFRFSTDANLLPTGLALNGEVEDYAQPILPLDYGDLPSTFPTTYSVDGARHIINTNGNPTLGSRVDAESDGQPNNAASGDDSNNSSFITHGSGSGDDEDGVSFNTLLVPGKVATITVSTLSAGSGGADGLLNAWVDFNNNGAFDPGEQIFTDTNLTAGSTNTLSFVVPSNAVTGTTYLRFRYSSETGLSPSGLALDGEVEDYRTEIVVVDYGDNPDRYGTTDAQNGPYHVITSTLYLGSQVDDELDGQPNDTARGDDQTGTPDDEDGVLFDNYSGTPALPIAIMQLGETSGLTVTTTGSGYLYGWVDLNGDGDFDDAGEMVVNGQAVSGAGNTVNVNVNVPSSVTTYTTYARFRLSDKTGLGPVGPQTSGNEFVYGEVEDYVIQLVDANKALSTTAESHTSGSDVAIGEVVQYDITITLPELTINNVRITDTLGTGLQYLTNTVRIAASSGVTTSGVTESGSPFGNGTDPIFNLGTITNVNTSPAQSEVLTLTFNALVLNVLANQDGTDLTNGFTVSYDNVVLTSEPVTVTVVEPDFTIDKQVSTAPSDAGDVVSYTVTYENTGNTTAFDVTLTDTLPITYLKLDLGSVSISSSGTVTSVNNNSSGNTVRVTVGGVAVGATVTVGYSATLTSTVELNQPITNTAYLTYTSLPGGNGTTGNPTGSNPPGSSGNPDGERNGSGGVNDYIITDSEQIEVNISVLTKAITTTSEAHTNFGGGYERLAIGEIVRYRLVFELPEGAAPNLQVQDVLTSNLQFMNDNTVKVAFIANGGGITSTTVTDAAADCPTLLFTGNSATGIEPTCVLTSTAVSGNVNFNLGTLVNRDNDSDAELVVVEFNALVLNNTDNNRGDILSNLFRVTTDQGTSPDSNTVDVQLVEPVLEISKQLNTTGIDAGDTISYTLSITNTATGNDAAAAFDVVISDTLPSQLTLAVSPTVSTAAVFTDSSSGSLIYVEFDRLDPGQSAEVTITATVASAAINGLAITNTAVVTGTSLPGDGTPNNPTGSTTPGASGDNNGERNGSDGPAGTPDDYYDEDDAAFSITSLPPGKTIDNTSAGNTSGLDVTIGEVITYQVTVDLPEGVVPGLTITDDIPVGLAYIPNSVVTDTTSFNGSFSPGDPTITSAGGSGDDLVIAYAGNINVTADNNPANNRLVFTFRTLVTDVVDNVGFGSGQTTLTNTVQLQVGNLPPQTSSAVTATVVEPNMVITKTMDPAEAGALSTTVITLTVANTGLSEAFDVIVEDPIPTTIFSNITPVVTPPGFAFSTIPSGTDTIVRYTGGSIDVNDIVTFVLTAQVTSPITDNLVITNVATITQATTLPGPDPNERNEPPVSDSDTLTTLSLSLGNRVWFDADNDGLLDPSESGIDGVVLQLLDSAGNPYDVDPVTPGTQTYTTTTVGGGYYTFTHLLADAYRVRVVNSNFQATGVLSTYVSSADVAGTS
ncbi:MAG: isopeptide-forming domain-containing fimbrial protein, partial [Anaerolineae bacterium]|nr:isopeptide-forming domain-containing fimbrial protein [Anaerolineae bacterium]